MFAKTLCRLTSSTKLITTKNPTLQNSRKQNMFTSYCRKQIIKGAKILFKNSVGLGPYTIEKVLLNNNYLVRKMGANTDAKASSHAIA